MARWFSARAVAAPDVGFNEITALAVFLQARGERALDFCSVRTIQQGLEHGPAAGEVRGGDMLTVERLITDNERLIRLIDVVDGALGQVGVRLDEIREAVYKAARAVGCDAEQGETSQSCP